MGRKRKEGRVFGRGLGRHGKERRTKHEGRPVFKIKRSKRERKDNIKVTIRKVRKAVKALTKTASTKKNVPLYAVFPSSEYDLKIKIRKIKNLGPKGYRFVNLECLQSHVSDITMHVCLCPEAIQLATNGQPPIKLETEVQSYGLASVITAQCQGCRKKFTVDTSPKVPGSKRFDINVRAVWGSMVTGNGPAHLNEFLATVNSPGLSQPTFTAIETEIGKWWKAVLEKEMLAAGVEERQLAVERKDFHQEIPAISVIADGGWSKRTHKHSYNAAGGVAIIIGKETKKLLHIGIRNKYCYVCSTDKNRPHTCFKNWDQDSQSMEGDIIVEGFLEAETKHGVSISMERERNRNSYFVLYVDFLCPQPERSAGGI